MSLVVIIGRMNLGAPRTCFQESGFDNNASHHSKLYDAHPVIGVVLAGVIEVMLTDVIGVVVAGIMTN